MASVVFAAFEWTLPSGAECQDFSPHSASSTATINWSGTAICSWINWQWAFLTSTAMFMDGWYH